MTPRPSSADFDVVTGAFGQTGHAVAQRLLAVGRRVKTLTRAPPVSGSLIEVLPVGLENRDALTRSLQGCNVLYSAIWSRFGSQGSYDQIVRQLATLFEAARDAGIQRIVQVTVATRDDALNLPYWKGKADVEEALRAIGVPHSILRPALIYSEQDTVVNNAAWAIRHLHVVPVPSGGACRIRPIAADDLGALAVHEGARTSGDRVVNAVGPDTLPFIDLLKTLRDAIGTHCLFPRMPTRAVQAASALMAPVLRDTLISSQELQGLVRGLYDVPGPTTCPTRFADWVVAHGRTLGLQYNSQRRRSRAKEWPNHGDGQP